MSNKWHIIRARGYVSVKSTNDDKVDKTRVYGTESDVAKIAASCLRALHDKGGWDTLHIIQALRDEVARQTLRDVVTTRQVSGDSSVEEEK